MSASLKNQQGFSLPEVMLAMVLMVMIVTASSQAGCVSISVTLVSPGGREGEMTRLHCPNRQ